MDSQRELLQLIADDGVAIRDTGRFRHILQRMRQPSVQFPQLVHFIGTTAKDEALRKLFSSSSFRYKRSPGAVDLHIHGPSLGSDNPLILLDSNPFMEPCPRNQFRSYRGAKQHRTDWLPLSAGAHVDILLARLLFLFTDVILLFAHDFPSLEDVVTRLGVWAKLGSASTLLSTIRPKVLIIVPGDASENLHIETLIQGHQDTIKEVFSSVETFRWSPDGPGATTSALKDSILGHAGDMLKVRRSNGCLFSAIHLEAFYQCALGHTAQTFDRPFHFIKATRLDNEIEEDYVAHVSNFLEQGFKLKVPYVHLAEFIASCNLMDAYPPGMHHFPPHDIYHSLYRSFCLRAIKQSVNSTGSVVLLSTLVERHMIRLFSHLHEYETSAHLHRANLSKQRCDWSSFRSNKTCLYCLRSRPRELLSCGHKVCDTCIRRHGEEAPGVEEKFYIPRCVLCQTEGSLTAILQPMTASMSILCIDGGGARGIIPLEFIGLMQEMIETPVQDLYDMDAGTSSGGIAVIALSILRWKVQKCIEIFTELTAHIFSEEPGRPRWFNRLKSIVRCAVLNSAYGPKTMEGALKEVFDEDRPMVTYHPEGFPQKRVIVTATEIGSPHCIAFNNYNGSEADSKGCGYKLLGDSDDVIPLWKIARATSAVPGIFPPVEIGSRWFEDGGMGRHNNPVHLALAEARRILPSGMVPDRVLSLGTGAKEDAEDAEETEEAEGVEDIEGAVTRSRGNPIFNFFQNFFAFRFFESMMRSTDGELTWGEVFSTLDTPSRASHVRFNVTLDGPLEITNVKVMTSLQHTVRNQPSIRQQALKSVLDALTARFYFVLDCAPKHVRKDYRCQGTIRCRGDSRTVVSDLIRLGSARMDFITDTEILGQLSLNDLQEDFCSHCRRYRKKVLFHVPCLTDEFSIYIKSGKMRWKISGLPQPMTWFIARQRFDAVFGSPNHGIPGQLHCDACISQRPISRAAKRKAEPESLGLESRAKRRKISR
ncbi:hypothetical protein AJ80_09405 [Polytolypa hystricis UAMH7299]|uniref:PNPLA domain-containing protein n=1 Tax=Polytolypa hystricis (strain UAMH7299) TaxID=1447883 RepID=A0A2B7WRN4_POLH7|nr:hypothetical protein AJ80_09405 [Polytolypa hystricis UAMH7299]